MAWTLNIQLHSDMILLGKRHLTFKMECISDGSQLAPTLLSTFTGWGILSADQKMSISYGRLVSLTTVPGTGTEQPLSAYDVSLYNGLGASIFVAPGRSISAAEITFPTIVSDVAPNMNGIPYLRIADLGDAGDKTSLYLEVCVGLPDIEEIIKKAGGSINLPV